MKLLYNFKSIKKCYFSPKKCIVNESKANSLKFSQVLEFEMLSLHF